MNTIIIHLTNRCNLRCRYCYNTNNIKNIELTERNIDTLICSIQKLTKVNKHPKIIFHGGEPLLINHILLGELMKKLSLLLPNVTYGIQTNLTKLNRYYIDLFHKYNMSVGFSLDGSNEVQNCLRVYQNGKPTYESVINNYKLLKELDIKTGAIISLNRYHIGKELELLNFIETNSLKCNIRPFYPTCTENRKYSLSPFEYATFFTNMFDIWFYSAESYHTFYISDFINIITNNMKHLKKRQSCSHQKECIGKYICIDADSNVYLCNRVYGIEDFLIGNLLKDSVDFISNVGINRYGHRWDCLSKDECNNCGISSICYGGCPAIAYSTTGNWYKKDYYCEAFKMINDHIVKRLKESES